MERQTVLDPASGNDGSSGSDHDPIVPDVQFGKIAEYNGWFLPSDDLDAVYDHDVPPECKSIPDRHH